MNKLNEFEYTQAMPSFAKYVQWYKTCRKYDIPETELNFATTLLDMDKYDSKDALLLMSEYNDNVSKEAATCDIVLQPVQKNDKTCAITGALCGLVAGLFGSGMLFAFLGNIF